MRTLLLYFTRLRRHYLALKLKWKHDKAISLTRRRWDYANRHPATPNEKSQE
jgi:hypothetical protein